MDKQLQLSMVLQLSPVFMMLQSPQLLLLLLIVLLL